VRAGQPAGGYFTDGINLYRFLGWVDGSEHRALAAVEDCRSLDVLLVSGNFVARPGVRIVSRRLA
jgi:hypothetical protein